jgi:phage shock protein E
MAAPSLVRLRLLFVLLLVLLFGLLFWAGAWAAEPLWIDVRTAEEYQQRHVSAAAHIPYEEITDRIGELTTDREQLIYLYCRSGRRSGIAMEALQKAGFSNVVNVGGLEEAFEKAAAENTP